ncbi:hypothetical protein E2C01_098925 [Portunus trituberculatus]|uniref:Uncharacterized protein n=1 Tax=Portunus trituberculatus TaxID=210409 RepID=A0A5B7K8Y7_PORTR|nr:hypothetical protein [Portunus trituberculatus]
MGGARQCSTERQDRENRPRRGPRDTVSLSLWCGHEPGEPGAPWRRHSRDGAPAGAGSAPLTTRHAACAVTRDPGDSATVPLSLLPLN